MAGTDRDDALRRRALDYHRARRGKVQVAPRVPIAGREELVLAYTPGVAAACEEIARDPEAAFEYTGRGNLVAVVSDGSAVLGLGDVGPLAALPVMEGKALLFKTLAGVDAVPLCVAVRDVDGLVALVQALEPSFAGINLEDIAAPRCFEVEARLRASLSIPVFHDDQHGTAIVVAAALLNAMRRAGRELADARVVVHGAGAAGLAVARLLLDLGVGELVVCDSRGALYDGRPDLNPYKAEIARRSNPARLRGGLGEVIRGAHVFIGLSVGGVLTPEMVRSMAPEPVVMALANPEPEIHPEAARAAGARVVCTGRSDYPNQINNALAFPGVFRGALDVRAREINESMKLAAARALAGLVGGEELAAGVVVPDVWDPRVVPAVALAVAEAARATGAARVRVPAGPEPPAPVEGGWA